MGQLGIVTTVMMLCSVVNCTNKEIRLVGGSTNREGRLEVCIDGRWGTVCDNSQSGVAGAVCSHLGFPAEGIPIKKVHC